MYFTPNYKSPALSPNNQHTNHETLWIPAEMAEGRESSSRANATVPSDVEQYVLLAHRTTSSLLYAVKHGLSCMKWYSVQCSAGR